MRFFLFNLGKKAISYVALYMVVEIVKLRQALATVISVPRSQTEISLGFHGLPSGKQIFQLVFRRVAIKP